MSYEGSKINPLPLTFETLPKYAKFIAKYGKTPTQYIKEQDDKNISNLINLDALQFSKLEKHLGSRHNLSAIPKNEDGEEMKTVTYFNTDLQKNVTVKMPAHMNIIPPKTGTLYKATGGKSKSKNKSKSKSKSKNKNKSKKNDSFNKIKNSIELGHTLNAERVSGQGTLVFNKDKFSNHKVKQLLQIAINKGDYKRAEMISFFT